MSSSRIAQKVKALTANGFVIPDAVILPVLFTLRVWSSSRLVYDGRSMFATCVWWFIDFLGQRGRVVNPKEDRDV